MAFTWITIVYRPFLAITHKQLFFKKPVTRNCFTRTTRYRKSGTGKLQNNQKEVRKRSGRVKGVYFIPGQLIFIKCAGHESARRLETGRQQDNEESMKIFGGEEFVIGWLQQEMFYWFNIQGLKPVWDSWVQSETEAGWPPRRLKYAGYLHLAVPLQYSARSLRSPRPLEILRCCSARVVFSLIANPHTQTKLVQTLD